MPRTYLRIAARAAIVVPFFVSTAVMLDGCATRKADSPPATVQVDSAKTETTPAASVAVPASAENAARRSISLADVIKAAREANLDLALARAQHEIAQARAEAAKYAFVPSLDFGGGASRINGLVQGAYGDFRDIQSESLTAGVGAGLRLNVPAKVQEAIAARAEADAALLDTMSAEQQLVLRVIELYEDLVLAKVARDIAQELVESSEKFAHLTSVRQEGGIGLGADVARAQANVSSSHQQLVQTDKLFANAGVRLAVTVRFDVNTALDPTDTALEAWQLPPEKNEIDYADGARARPDVASAQYHAEAAGHSMRARWWDLVAPELAAEWRFTGVGGEGSTPRPETGSALSSAAGSVGRSLSAWQNAATALGTPGTNPLPALSTAAGSGGRAYYAYHNLLDSTEQDRNGLTGQERYGVWLNWSLSFAKVSRLREQRLVAKAADLRAAKAEDTALAEVRLAQNDIQADMKLIAMAKDEITSAETSHRLSLARFSAGTAIAFEVLNAQDAIAEARLKLARYIADLNVAQSRLLTAAGMIDTAEVSATGPAGTP